MRNRVGFIALDEFNDDGINAVIVDNGHRLSIMFDYRQYAPKDDPTKSFMAFKATVDNGEHLKFAEKGEKLSLTLKSTEDDVARGNIEIAINTTTCPRADFNDVYQALNKLISTWILGYWAK